MAEIFDNAEFIAIIDELTVDAPDVVIKKVSKGGTYNPQTLRYENAVPSESPAKLIFFFPGLSTTVKYDTEIDEEEFAEKKTAILVYRGIVAPRDTVVMPDGTEYIVTAVMTINPLGVTLYYRVKLGR